MSPKSFVVGALCLILIKSVVPSYVGHYLSDGTCPEGLFDCGDGSDFPCLEQDLVCSDPDPLYWECDSGFDEANCIEGIPDEKSGFVEVRTGAHMFWWFYGSKNKSKRDTLPVVLWLQGGPGAGGSGYGNLGQIGPKDEFNNSREYSWVDKVNLLIIDSPVGAGYSYVTNDNLYTKNLSAISRDLLTIHKELIKTDLPFLEYSEYHIFSESYGGKMATAFANVLMNAVTEEEIYMDLKSVTNINPWMSPVDLTVGKGEYLYSWGLITKEEKAKLDVVGKDCEYYANINDWENVRERCYKASDSIKLKIGALNKYNILRQTGTDEDQLWKIMNNKIKEHLKDAMSGHLSVYTYWEEPALRSDIGKSFGGSVTSAFYSHYDDFLKPAINEVEALLKTDVKINIWSGVFDLGCNGLGQLKWISKLNWKHLTEWQATPKEIVPMNNGHTCSTGNWCYTKKSNNGFGYYNFMDSGHYIARNSPAAAMQAMCEIVGVEF